MKSALSYLSVAAVAATFAVTGFAQGNKLPGSSGNWGEVTWLDSTGAVTTAPVTNNNIIIGGNRSVNFNTGTFTSMALDVGANNSYGWLPAASGEFTVSGGTFNVGSNFRLARQDGVTGTVNVTGGNLYATNNLDVGYANTAAGIVNITSGKLSVNNIQLSYASGSTGSLTISGGELEVRSSAILGRRIAGTTNTNASFEQTGGKVTVAGTFGIGNGSQAVSESTNATVRLTGGEFAGNVVVGSNFGGSGELTIGPAADINSVGNSGSWTVNQTGKIIFELGSDDNFNAVDLTLNTLSNALVFGAGSEVVVDGSNLIFSETYGPINFFTFLDGHGPTELSKSNVSFNFIGFDASFIPELVWTNTSLQLNLNVAAIPEPSTYAAIFASVALGLAVVRRRRQLAKAV